MINISKLYCDEITPGDWLRYGREGSGERAGEIVPKQASERRPIVVWNITRTCNLRCVHCYNDSGTDDAHLFVVDKGAVQAAEVIDRMTAPFRHHAGMPARYAGIGEMQLAGGIAANVHRPTAQDDVPPSILPRGHV